MVGQRKGAVKGKSGASCGASYGNVKGDAIKRAPGHGLQGKSRKARIKTSIFIAEIEIVKIIDYKGIE